MSDDDWMRHWTPDGGVPGQPSDGDQRGSSSKSPRSPRSRSSSGSRTGKAGGSSRSGTGRSRRRPSRRKKRTRRIVLWSVLGVLVVMCASAVWIGARAWLAKGELEAAIPLATQIQSQIAAADTEQAKQTATELQARASRAAALTSDPIWRVAEIIPGLGPNLSAFRQAAEVTDSIATDAIWPLANNVAAFGADSFQPVDGKLNLEPIVEVQQSVSAATVALERATTQVSAIDTSSTIGQISDAVKRLQSTVVDANRLMDGVNNAVDLLPKMLGGDGPRNYLLIFQNPAELRAGGGVTSALALVNTNDGAVSLVKQESSSSFPVFDPPALALPDDARGLYTDRPAKYVQNTTLVPQFELSGQIASAMWTSTFGDPVDGVLSFDPISLSYLLKATGPVSLPTGEELTSENAVSFLLSDVYARYPDPAVQDAVFASAAKAAFDRVSSGGLDVRSMIAALVRAGDEDRLLIWSAHPEDQEVLAGTSLAGELPAVTATETGIGVYFNDATGSKMDYYLDTAVSSAAELCRADGRPAVQVKVTLTNTAPEDAGVTLPEYVTGGGAFGVAPGNISTMAYIYGPASVGELTDATIVTRLDAGADGAPSYTSFDGDHTVAVFPVELAPGETRTVTVEFLAQKGNPLDITARITPTIKPSVYSTEINTGFSGCEVR